METQERQAGHGRGEGDAAEHGIDADVSRRSLLPVAQIADDHVVVLHLRRLLRDVVARDLDEEAPVEARAVAVVVGARAAHELSVRVEFADGERAARDARRHVDRLGERGDALLGDGQVEERRVVAERAEEEVSVVAECGGDCVRARERVGAKAPEEDADVRDVVAPAAARDAAHVGRVRDVGLALKALEGRAEIFEPIRVAHVEETLVLRPQVVHVLRRREQLKELDGARGPARHVAGQLLKHRRRALATPVADGVGHLGARAEGRSAGGRQARDADEIADVGEHPRRGRLHELIVVELLQIVLQHVGLIGYDRQQCAQGAARLRVARAIDGGQHREEFFGVVSHGIVPRSFRGSRSSSSNSAPGVLGSAPGAGASASSTGLSDCDLSAR